MLLVRWWYKIGLQLNMALPLSPLSKYATVESMKAPQTMQAYICIKLHNNTRLKYLIGTFTSLASVYRMIVLVIVPPGNLGSEESNHPPLRIMRWIRWHCPPDTGFEIRTLAVWGRAHYLSVMEDPGLHTILTSDLYEWAGKKYAFLWNLNARAGDEPAISRIFKQTAL